MTAIRLCAAFAAALTFACAPPRAPLPTIEAARETSPVASPEDAADDPAIWIDRAAPENSLILGTDKQAGLYAYGLDGGVRQFLPAGALNNIDLRQDAAIGDWTGDIAAASNRTDNTITLFTIDRGVVARTGAFASAIVEPYGLCMGRGEDGVLVFVTYKTGDLVAYRLTAPDAGAEIARLKLKSQLEGCVFDDDAQLLFIGEEGRGVFKAPYADGSLGPPVAVDRRGGPGGLVPDVEGMSLYKTGDRSGYLIVSSQGDDSFAVYDREGDNRFIGRFRIGDGAAIDGVEETDGLDAHSAPLGPEFPKGVLVVQDGFNLPEGAAQNYKIVDWRAVEAAIGLAE